MKKSLKIKMIGKNDISINSSLTIIKLKSFNEKNVINTRSIKNINYNNKKNQIKNDENIIFIVREFLFNLLILSILVQNIISICCQNTIISKDSFITLKVCQNGIQKIFNNGTRPNEIWIDNEIKPFINNSYSLNNTNIVKLIWQNEITNCFKMFYECNTIIEINFTYFEASKCRNLEKFFQGCNSLISLDLSGFISSNLLYRMCGVFMNCYSLISVNLSNFDTSNVLNFGHMFYNCKSLTWIDMSNFNTRKVKYLDYMFYGCKKLESLNLSNFVSHDALFMDNMFSECDELKRIDFPNFDLTSVTNIETVNNIFFNCTNLEYINIKNLKSNIILESNYFFSGTPKNLVICVDNSKKQLFNNSINNNCIILSCNGKLPENEYINTENGCFTENCLLTNYKYEFENYCYEDCPANSKKRDNTEKLEGYDENGKFFCKPICNETFPYEIISTQKCVKNCDLSSLLNKSCILNYQVIEKKRNIDIFDTLLENIEDIFTSNNYDISDIENGNNNVIKYKQMTVTLTSTKSQQKDEKIGNVSTINIGDCEKILKDEYNISKNETLFMKKIEAFQEGMIIPKIEFDLYYKLNGTNLAKLNLSYCSNTKIDISIPIKLPDNIDKYNSSSRYYNDICYVSTSDDGTDITLKDRKEEFMNKNMTVCQDNCFFSGYNYTTNVAKCSCDIKESSSFFDDIKIDKSKLYENFIDIKNIANINILVCYKVLFSKKGIIKNYGNYFLILIIIAHLIIIIIFYSLNFIKEIQNIIKVISNGIDNFQSSEKENRKNNKKEVFQKSKYNNEKKKKNKGLKNVGKKYSKKINLNKRNLKNIEKHSKNNNKLNLYSYSKEIIIYQKNKNELNIDIDNKSKQIQNIMSYNDEELNELNYEFALQCDKRKYCEYYYSLLKSKHALIFTFCNNTDYNSKIIKIDLLLFNIALFYFVNAIFFNDDTMHKIYKNKGAFDILGQLPQIIYSSIISIIFGIVLELLALTEGTILDIKKIKLKQEFKMKIRSLYTKIKCKFLLYFIINTIFLLFFWYYLSMFCAIYSNTQIHLIKDTLLSFTLSLIEPFGIYLIPGFFRIPALSEQNKNRYILYKFSKILQMILI